MRRVGGAIPTPSGLEEPTFACQSCLDRGYVISERPDRHFPGRVVQVAYARACGNCETGQAIMRGEKIERLKRELKRRKHLGKLDGDRKMIERGELPEEEESQPWQRKPPRMDW